MATRWPTEVDNAIAEAVASGMRFIDAFSKLRAGTLPGLDEPVPVPRRTFSGKWSRAKKAQERARAKQEPALEQDESRPRPKVMLDRLSADFAEHFKQYERVDRLRAGGKTPEAIVEETGIQPALVVEVFMPSGPERGAEHRKWEAERKRLESLFEPVDPDPNLNAETNHRGRWRRRENPLPLNYLNHPPHIREWLSKLDRAKAMIRDGASVEEAAEVLGTSVHIAHSYLASALAERDGRAASRASV